MNSTTKTIFVASILLSLCPAQATVSHARQIDKYHEILKKDNDSYMSLVRGHGRNLQDIRALEINIRQNKDRMEYGIAMKQEDDLLCARQDAETWEQRLWTARIARSPMYSAQR